jgi:hypothetical protein
MSSKEFKALEEKNIKIGDTVTMVYRGNIRQGRVKKIATTTEETPHPPKVYFDAMTKDGELKEVAHNPSTLEKVG